MSTGAILVADIIPALLVKLISPVLPLGTKWVFRSWFRWLAVRIQRISHSLNFLYSQFSSRFRCWSCSALFCTRFFICFHMGNIFRLESTLILSERMKIFTSFLRSYMCFIKLWTWRAYISYLQFTVRGYMYDSFLVLRNWRSRCLGRYLLR